MQLTMLGQLTGSVHLRFRVPALEGVLGDEAQATLDITIVDQDKDGDPEIEITWDVPGSAFDGNVTTEVPVSILFGPLVDLVDWAMAKGGAPRQIIDVLRALIEDTADFMGVGSED